MSNDDQSRLQEYGEVGAPPVEEEPPACDRCGCELDEDDESGLPFGAGYPEHESGFVDIRKIGDAPAFCEDCENLNKYLNHRHNELIQKRNVSAVVAVYCECQGDHEVDVRPVRYGDRQADVACSRCGSREVVIEELPPSAPKWRVDQ